MCPSECQLSTFLMLVVVISSSYVSDQYDGLMTLESMEGKESGFPGTRMKMLVEKI